MNFNTTTLVSFLSGGCADEIVDNWVDYQWYEYVYFIHWQLYVTLMVKEFGRLSEKLF